MRSMHKIGTRPFGSRTRWGRAFTASLLIGVSGIAMLSPGFAGATELAAWQNEKKADDKKADDKSTTPPDVIIFPDGRVIEGWILVQTPTTVKFKGVVKGMTFEREYQRSELLSVKKGVNKPAEGSVPAVPKEADKKAEVKKDGAADSPETAEIAQKYYWVDLKGNFGSEISQKPLREAFKDARQQGADVIIVSLDAKWEQPEESNGNKIQTNDNIDELFRAEPLAVVLTEEVERDWVKQPKIVVWVKQAMGGAAFLPFVSKNIYFHSEGHMGGVGNLGQLFEGVGDKVVQEKQRSLRLGHAEGWALKGGYDLRLIRAMARSEYVMSYRIKDGKVELFEGLPSGPGEELLTDDGVDDRLDTLQDIARGTGNDVLTLNARNAKVIGVSKGTFDTKDDLLSELSLDRSGKDVSNKSARIMKDWTDGIANAKRDILKAMEDMQRGPQGKPSANPRDDQRKALGFRRALLERIKRLLEDWDEALTPRWRGENRVPAIPAINVELERIRQELIKLK